MKRSAVFGLWNLLGIIGLLVWAFSQTAESRYSLKQLLSFVIIFSIVFVAVVLMVMLAAYIPLL